MSHRKRGIDSLLTSQGKAVPAGGTVAFRLVKGPGHSITADPVDPKAPHETFPLVAKFPESVVKPNFQQKPWSDGRLYQQDVPKPAEDSDEETQEQKQQPRKRWKYNRRQDAARRQWILQEQVDFLETMVARRERRNVDAKKLSTRYEGFPEHNPSHYVLLMPHPEDNEAVQVRTLPTPNATIAFAQPASRKTYSLSEAEQVIQDQRMGVRNLHHLHDKETNATNTRPLLTGRKPHNSKSRLLNKLKAKEANDEDEGDDVMGDVAFRNRKGGGAARKELLSSMGDGVHVSDDGVIGGTNDQMFGGKQRFGAFKAEETKKEVSNPADQTEERGADGAAMEQDFYQRDVQAEYEDLDYDANEQFDDDDLEMGEGEVQVGEENFGDEDFEDELDDLDEDENIGGAEGLATIAGFKALLAKARGDAPVQPVDAEERNAAKRPESPKEEQQENHLDKILRAAEKSRETMKEKAKEAAPPPTAATIQVDDAGLRIITLDAVRREIWLNHGSIEMKRLMKIFDVKKKSSADRQNKFRDVVKELCTMKSDPLGARLLVLKQHYSNMG